MFIYTRHAASKLKIKDNKILKITKKHIEEVTQKGNIIEDEDGVITIIDELDTTHSLCVIYRVEEENTVIITFFAAKKGRYERKILH